MASSNPFIEVGYVYAPYVPMQTSSAIFRPSRRGWYRKEELTHFEPNRDTWEFAPGDIVRKKGEEKSTIGIIGRCKWQRHGSPDGDYESYEVDWGEHGPVGIQVESINVNSRRHTRKLNVKWTAKAADDIIAIHGIDAEAKIK